LLVEWEKYTWQDYKINEDILSEIEINPVLEKIIYFITQCVRGPGSSVGIAILYGLDGPVSNSGGEDIFRSFRPTVGPTQPPVKFVPALSRG